MNQFCQIEYVSSDSDVGTPCNKPAVARCADCGTVSSSSVGRRGSRRLQPADITSLRQMTLRNWLRRLE